MRKIIPFLPVDGTKYSLDQIFLWIRSNYLKEKVICPFCFKAGVSWLRFTEHVRNRCKADFYNHGNIFGFLIKQMKHVQHPDQIILFLDLCKVTNEITYLQANGLINSFKLTDIKGTKFQHQFQTMKRRFRRHLLNQNTGFMMILKYVEQVGFVLHSNHSVKCNKCCSLISDECSKKSSKADCDSINDILRCFRLKKIVTRTINRPVRFLPETLNKPYPQLMTSTSSSLKCLIDNNLKGFNELVQMLKRYNVGSRKNHHHPPALATVYQMVRIILDDNICKKSLMRHNFGRLVCDQTAFSKVLEFYTHESVSPQAVARKLAHLRLIYEHLMHDSTIPMVRENATRYLDKLKSYNYTKRPTREANATKSDKKCKFELAKDGCYLSAKELTDLGDFSIASAFDKMEKIQACDILNHQMYLDLQKYVIMTLMLKGPCYRSEEYRFMLLNTLFKEKDNSWKCFVVQNKNRSRKQRGAMLYFDKRFNHLLTRFIKIRLKLTVTHNFVWVKSLIDSRPLSAHDLSALTRKFCHDIYGHFGGGTPMMLRFLQSAHIWSKFKQGDISQDQMQKLCSLFDRSIETWQKDYAFTDEILDRNPGEENNALLWQLCKDDRDTELLALQKMQMLKDITSAAIENLQQNEPVKRKKFIPNDNDFKYDHIIKKASNQDLKIEPDNATAVQDDVKMKFIMARLDSSSESDEIEELDAVTNALEEERSTHGSFWIFDSENSLVLQRRDLLILQSTTSWLTDAHLSGAIGLIFRQFQVAKNLEMPLYSLQANLQRRKITRRLMQHAHENDNHWILLDCVPKTNGYIISVYDSLLQKKLSSKLQSHIDRIFGVSQYQLIFKKCQNQNDGSSCGLFTIANAVELCFNDKICFDYDTAKMRPHLINCFEKRHMTPFPRINL
jgi:hypothetical protein